MKLSLFDSPSDIDTAVADTTRAEAAGFRRYWNPQVMHADTIRTGLEAYKAAGTTEVALDILGAREAIAPLGAEL